MMDQQRLQSILHYDPESGVFTWLCSPNSQVRKGMKAGRLNRNGYVEIGVARKVYAAHRLAWLYVHGCFPKETLDHINGVRSDNKMSNLREATAFEQQQNRLVAKNNKSGFTGVTWNEHQGAFRAQIKTKAIGTKHLGSFTSAEAAHAAYCASKAQLHPFNPAPVLRKNPKVKE